MLDVSPDSLIPMVPEEGLEPTCPGGQRTLRELLNGMFLSGNPKAMLPEQCVIPDL
jgi:hypothetical protein